MREVVSTLEEVDIARSIWSSDELIELQIADIDGLIEVKIDLISERIDISRLNLALGSDLEDTLRNAGIREVIFDTTRSRHQRAECEEERDNMVK